MATPEADRGFRWVDERVLHEGFVITVSKVIVEAPDGERYDRDVVHHPGAVAVVPLHADGSVTLVRQYRAPLQGDLLEIPAGKRDVPGEPPELTAGRELAEEVGLEAGQLVKLAAFYNSAGFSDELSHVFLGLDLREVPSQAHGVEEEHMTIERVPLRDVPAMVADGRLCDGKTIIGLLAALRWVDAHG
jgi:8-oxo-dGTP pyrophosphatase MutT (NUDIX family)